MLVDLVEFSDFNELEKSRKILGTQKVIIAKHFSSSEELEQFKGAIKNNSLPVFACHVLEKPFAKELNSFKGKADFIAVRGGNVQSNSFAVNSREVDFLLCPVSSAKNVFDVSTANISKQNRVRVVFLFSDFLEKKPFSRSLLLKNALFVSKVLKKIGWVPLVFSGAKNFWQMRAPQNIESFGVLLGVEKAGIKEAIEELFEKGRGK
jgi:RNase P/RNase MRP subunit p30